MPNPMITKANTVETFIKANSKLRVGKSAVLKHGRLATAYEEYTYLPEDWRRITRKIGTIRTTGNHTKDESETFVSVYDGADESNEYKLNNNHKIINRRGAKSCARNMKLVKSYISGPNTDDIEFTRSKNKSLAMLKDGLGSTIVLSDKNGRSIARIGYDAWGNFRWSKKAKESCGTNNYDEYLERFCNTRGFGYKNHNSWSFGKKYAKKLTPYLYAGRRFNRFTTQYFHRNRYYQPKYGRFTSKDRIGFSGDVNLYRYANDNPVLFTDPMGLRPPIVSGLTSMDMRKIIITNMNLAKSMNPFDFEKYVRPGGTWDYKKYHPHDKGWENFGNYNFGLMGAATHDYYLTTLLREAGIAQCKTKTSDERWGLPSTGEPYGDDPNDQYWIKQGWQDFQDGLWAPPDYIGQTGLADAAELTSQVRGKITKCPKKKCKK